jgi:tRNA (guanine-N7-)-methyltransferase
MTEALDRPRAFYGRRKGKKLRKGHEDLVATLLPQLRVPETGRVDLGALFRRGPSSPSPVQGEGREGAREARPNGNDPTPTPSPCRGGAVLEIGFGGGEHLAAEARAHPEIGFIGCEPFLNGMAKMLATIEREGFENVRLWDRDATGLLPRLPPSSFDLVYLLYPDPWPKRRQRKRRFLNEETLAAIARILKPGGELRFATDIDDYAGWALSRVLCSADLTWTAERPDDWRKPWPGWPGTRYEAKAISEGRVPSYLTFRRV